MSKKHPKSKRLPHTGEASRTEASRVNLGRMESQIDELYSKISILENFANELQPGIGKIAKEIGQTVNELRERYERDETIELLKKIGDNIPTFVELLNTMEAVKGMMTDIMPATVKIIKETSDTVNDLRIRFERDETITLLKKVGDNIPTFVKLLPTMEAVKGMMTDMVPAVASITHEVSGTVNEFRLRFEKDESLELLKKVGDNIPTFVELLSTMEAVKGMMTDMVPAASNITYELGGTINEFRQLFERDETLMILKHAGENIPIFAELLGLIKPITAMATDMMPAAEKITKELMPTINMLREALEKEEVLVIIKQLGENLPTFVKLMAFFTTFEKTGNLDLTLEEALTRETEMLMKGLLRCVRKTIHQIEEKPVEPGTWKLISSVFDEEVQKGLLMMISLAKNMHECMTGSESDELKQKFKEAEY